MMLFRSLITALFPRRWRRGRMARIQASATSVKYADFLKRRPLSKTGLRVIASSMDQTMYPGALR